MSTHQHVAPELRHLVSQSLQILGEVIRDHEGQEFYADVESLRLLTRSLRGAAPTRVHAELLGVYQKLQKRRDAGKHFAKLTQAFGLALELINICEMAYRSFRLTQQNTAVNASAEVVAPTSITWVFTAHPTEARQQKLIDTFLRIQTLLQEYLEAQRTSFPQEPVRYLLSMAWQHDLAPTTKPSVSDEAHNILHRALGAAAQNVALSFSESSPHRLRFRSWVGGDKDGHPGVGPAQTLAALQISRRILIEQTGTRLREWEHDLNSLAPSPQQKRLLTSSNRLSKNLNALRTIKTNDGVKLEKWKIDLARATQDAQRLLQSTPIALAKIGQHLAMFPSLVMPLEMREDAAILKTIAAAKPPVQKQHAIVKMLSLVARLTGKAKSQHYVHSFVISQFADEADFENARAIVKTHLGDTRLPIVPLFENRAALENSEHSVSKLLSNTNIKKQIQNDWHGTLELMIGYSDSAKEMGVLSSRNLIAQTLPRLAALCKTQGITPVFFHGSGGSVSRGGGSTSEQCSWWPAEAREHIKMTIQGEMVQRSLASDSVLLQNLKKLLAQNQVAAPKLQPESSALRKLIATQEAKYRDLTSNPEFLELVAQATPYDYLQHLKIGSRPTSRKKLEGVSSLRAIPWVLCWTQTRTLLPIWWGVGTAWKSLSAAEQAIVRQDFKNSPLVSSYVKQLGFSLAKVEPGIWKLYLDVLAPDLPFAQEFFTDFEGEFESTCDFVRAMSGEKDLMWFRPWLGASIRVRSPMIYPLHLAQLWSLKKADVALMRQTVTAIASGMLTTG